MQTQSSVEQLEFSCVERRRVVAAFDGGRVSSDAGALLLKRTDEAIRLIDRLAECFVDYRDPGTVEHSVRTLVAQRVFRIALGYEDVNDHETLRHDPVFGVLIGKLTARRSRCAAPAGKSALNRLELYPSSRISRYHKIMPQGEAIERLWVEQFLNAHREAPAEIVLDLDATDDPASGGRFFHASTTTTATCRYISSVASTCCAPSYAVATSMRAQEGGGAAPGGARVGAHPPARPALQGTPLCTRRSWSRRRCVVGKAEHTGDKSNPRFVVSSLSITELAARELYEQLYCARGEMENRIKEA